MKNIIAAAGGILLLAGQVQAAKNLPQREIARINEVTEAFSKAVVARDWAAVEALYTDDAVLYPPNEPPAQGRSAIRASMEKFPVLTDFKLMNEKVEGRGDLAYVAGAYMMTIAPAPDASEAVKVSGRYVEIRRKQKDGRWLIALDMYTLDMPAAPPTQPIQAP
jgi:uncharacterized protein (TIGR02246 family)